MIQTVKFDMSYPEAAGVMQFLRTLPFAEVEGDKKKSYREACTECGAVPLETFINELRSRIEKWPDNA